MTFSSRYRTVDPDKFRQLMCEEHILIDVRTVDEFDESHILNAVNIPLGVITDYVETIKLQNKAKSILIYCQSGARGATAARVLASHNCIDIYNLSGGISAWNSKFGI